MKFAVAAKSRLRSWEYAVGVQARDVGGLGVGISDLRVGFADEMGKRNFWEEGRE